MLKYGVVGAIALAVLVAAMWDGNKTKKKEGDLAKGDPTKVESALDTTVSGEVGAPVASRTDGSLTPPLAPQVASQPVKPEVEVIEKYQVHPRDTLRSIARTWLGDEKLAEALLDFNKTRIPDARHLSSHLTLTFPRSRFVKKTGDAAPAPTETASDTSVPAGMKKSGVTATDVPAGDKKYVVKEGDTLYGIAARELGKGSRFKEIKTINNLTSDTLKKGQTLQLPSK